MIDPYSVLGVDPDATPEEIRAAFRRAIRSQHPDISPTDVDDSRVRQLIEAYRALIGPDSPSRRGTDFAPETPLVNAGIPCSACDGSGWLISSSSCPSCAGSGRTTVISPSGSGSVRCRTCRGAGWSRTRQPCPTCAGTGVSPG